MSSFIPFYRALILFTLMGFPASVQAFGLSEKANLALSKQHCSDGYQRSCSALGYRYLRGNGVIQDFNKAVMYFKDACNEYDAFGCIELAKMYEKGQYVEQSSKVATNLFIKACKGGSGWGCGYVGDSYSLGRGIDQDFQKAAHLYKLSCDDGLIARCKNIKDLMSENKIKKLTKQATLAQNKEEEHRKETRIEDFKFKCKNGDLISCTILGNQFLVDDVFVGKQKSIPYFEMACEGGEPISCHLFAQYFTGHGEFERDYESAFFYYQRSCEGGYILSCLELGDFYQRGKGVKRDYVKALSLFKEACDNGWIRGCPSLGLMYKKTDTAYNTPVKNLDTLDADELEKSCRAENYKACYQLGKRFKEGNGVKFDFEKARQLYKKACYGRFLGSCTSIFVLQVEVPLLNVKQDIQHWEQECNVGLNNACNTLGDLYIEGHGVRKNVELAIRFYKEGCRQGDKKSCNRLEMLSL